MNKKYLLYVLLMGMAGIQASDDGRQEGTESGSDDVEFPFLLPKKREKPAELAKAIQSEQRESSKPLSVAGWVKQVAKVKQEPVPSNPKTVAQAALVQARTPQIARKPIQKALLTPKPIEPKRPEKKP